jgi:hypothetical protein
MLAGTGIGAAMLLVAIAAIGAITIAQGNKKHH